MIYNYKNINEIFNTFKIFYIPYYQRKYVWNKVSKGRNLYKFIDDIVKQFTSSSESSYFIGTFAFCNTSIVDIVDGQQRITSLILLLSILANNFCSIETKNKHKNILYNDKNFILQEPYYLTEELQGVLGYRDYQGGGFKVKLDETVSKIKNMILKDYKFTTKMYDQLYKFILNNVYAIYIEYNNNNDALKYFLNINSMSAELTQAEIFYTILSQALVISKSNHDINSYISNIDNIVSDYKGIKQPEDIIYLYLSAYFDDDQHILDLNELGVGKWMSFYHTEILNSVDTSKNFANNFARFLQDLNTLLQLFSNRKVIETDNPIYLSFSLFNYEKYFDLLDYLEILFKYRHNYKNKSIYDKNNQLDLSLISEIQKRFNLTVINNYIRDSNKRLDGFIKNIESNNQNEFKLSLIEIIDNMNLDNIFTLGYLSSFESDPKINIPDKSRQIKVILSLQQSYLNFINNDSNSMFRYFAELIEGQKYNIEHLYSRKEYTDQNRIGQWKIKGKFITANDFDIERSKFENLSLINASTNSSANDDIIYDKLTKYKNAHSVLTSEPELLIQSLVPDSEFYSNKNIMKLNLPNREIDNIFANTWEHSKNNRKFNKLLLNYALLFMVK
jgi:hypothetical protein